jgi:antitoxin CptB
MNESIERARIAWCCRRGMLELDLLLGRFMEQGYAMLDAEQKKVFMRLLEEPDPDLYAWLMGSCAPQDEQLKQFVIWFREHFCLSGKLE